MRESFLAQERYCIQCLLDYMMIYLCCERKTFLSFSLLVNSQEREEKERIPRMIIPSSEFHARSIPFLSLRVQDYPLISAASLTLFTFSSGSSPCPGSFRAETRET